MGRSKPKKYKALRRVKKTHSEFFKISTLMHPLRVYPQTHKGRPIRAYYFCFFPECVIRKENERWSELHNSAGMCSIRWVPFSLEWSFSEFYIFFANQTRERVFRACEQRIKEWGHVPVKFAIASDSFFRISSNRRDLLDLFPFTSNVLSPWPYTLVYIKGEMFLEWSPKGATIERAILKAEKDNVHPWVLSKALYLSTLWDNFLIRVNEYGVGIVSLVPDPSPTEIAILLVGFWGQQVEKKFGEITEDGVKNIITYLKKNKITTYKRALLDLLSSGSTPRCVCCGLPATESYKQLVCKGCYSALYYRIKRRKEEVEAGAMDFPNWELYLDCEVPVILDKLASEYRELVRKYRDRDMAYVAFKERHPELEKRKRGRKRKAP